LIWTEFDKDSLVAECTVDVLNLKKLFPECLNLDPNNYRSPKYSTIGLLQGRLLLDDAVSKNLVLSTAAFQKVSRPDSC
jgi:hypothetical protein